jgi:hypothetical protein
MKEKLAQELLRITFRKQGKIQDPLELCNLLQVVGQYEETQSFDTTALRPSIGLNEKRTTVRSALGEGTPINSPSSKIQIKVGYSHD